MSMNARFAVGLVVLLSALPSANASEVEERQFAIALDGQRVGEYRMKITREDDDTLVFSGEGQMKLSQPGGNSYYRYRGTEVWKDGRLLRLDSTSSDDVKQTTVSAAGEAKGVRVVVGGKERVVPDPVWVTTYWQLPAVDVRAKPLTLLDADNGNAPVGHLERLGTGQVVVGGRPASSMRYKLTGGAQVDLWYDAQDRLVRQEWSHDGRRAAPFSVSASKADMRHDLSAMSLRRGRAAGRAGLPDFGHLDVRVRRASAASADAGAA